MNIYLTKISQITQIIINLTTLIIFFLYTRNELEEMTYFSIVSGIEHIR